MRSRSCPDSVHTILAAAALLLAVAAPARAQVEIWTTRYDAGYDREDEVSAMALTTEDDVVVTGFSLGPDLTKDWATVKVDGATGDTVWVRRWRAASNTNDVATAVATDTLGNVFAVGYANGGNADTNCVTVKYNPDGSQAWMSWYHLRRGDRGVAVVADNQGGVYVAGVTGDTSSRQYDVLLLHYGVDGSQVWAVTYDGPAHGNDFATGVALDPSGSIAVCGYSWTSAAAGYDYLVLKFASTGDTLWTRRYDGTEPLFPKDDFGFGLAVDDSGCIYVTGSAVENGTYYDATTVKYSPAGAQLWVNRFDWGENSFEGASVVRVSRDGAVVCGGITETGLGADDMLVYSLGTDSITDWMRNYNYVNDDDSVTSLCLDAYGNAYVAGASYSLEYDLDWVLAKYNSEGSQMWLLRHSVFDEDDVPFGVGVDRLGNIFVGGYDCFEGTTDYAVAKFSEYDVGAGMVVAPTDTYRLDAAVVPKVWIRNYSALELTFPVRLEIGNFYFDQQNVAALAPYDSVLLSFTPWPVRDTGNHVVRCYSMLTGDKEPGNDTSYGACTGVYVWELLAPVPLGPKTKDVKDGGALGFCRDSLVYGFKGNNTTEFYRYNTRTRTWTAVESIPPVGRSGSRKRVKNGARLAPDTVIHIYVFKGNNTFEFWRYNTEADSWRQLTDVPPGASGRKVKGGSGLVYIPRRNMVFGVKGSNTVETYGWFCNGDTWHALKPVPTGESNRRVKDGSCIAYDGDTTVYLLKGSTYEFWAYLVTRDTWVRKDDIRNSEVSTRRRKPKKGAALAYDTEFRRVYASKGGKVSEWWYFDVALDSWVESRDTFPRWPSGKGPYGGADLVYGNGKIYALKGNKTREFWRYNANFPLNPPGFDGQQAVPGCRPTVRLHVAPNPVAGRAMIRYVLPQAGHIRLVLYDITGRQQMVVLNEARTAGAYSQPLSVRGLANGIYLARLELVTAGGDVAATRKVLVAR